MWHAAEPEELILRARHGDPDAFAALVAGERPGLVRAAWAILGDLHEAEDAVQEALYRAFVHIGQLEAAGGFRPWLRRITVNQAKNRLRALAARHAREAGLPEAKAWERLLVDLAETPHGRIEAVAATAHIRAAVTGLPARQRQVLTAAADGQGIGEIAAQLGMRAGSVRVALHRGRAALAARLEDGCRPLRAASAKGGRSADDAEVRLVGWRQMEIYVAAYAEAHPDQRLAFVSDQQWDGARSEWDVCYTDLYGPIAGVDRSALQPLPAGASVPIAAHAAAAHSAGGALWAVPVVEHPHVLLFSPQLFAEAGVAAPTVDWTWADVQAALRAFAAGGRYGLTGGCGPALVQWMAGQLAARMPPESALSEGLRMAREATAGPWVHPAAEGQWVRDAFYQGEAAMTVGTPGNPRWRLRFAERPCRLREWDAVVPRFLRADPVVADWAYSSFVFSRNARRLDAALRFTNWVATRPAVGAPGWWGWPACTEGGALEEHRSRFPPLIRARSLAWPDPPGHEM